MDPFALLDDDAADQINFAQAVEALATGDPKRVRAADPEWRKRHACDHPPCYLSEGWSADHFDGYTFLWSGMILGKVMTTDQDGVPHSSMRYQDSRWIYAEFAAGAVGGPYDERGNSMWPVFDVLSLVEDGTRLSVPDLEDLIRDRDAAKLAKAPIETPVEMAPAPIVTPARVRKAPVKAKPANPFEGRRGIPRASPPRCWRTGQKSGSIHTISFATSWRRRAYSGAIIQTSDSSAARTRTSRRDRLKGRSGC